MQQSTERFEGRSRQGALPMRQNVARYVRALGLKPTDYLIPIFEAVSNAIQGINAKPRKPKSPARGTIDIILNRIQPNPNDRSASPGPVESISIVDNGVGFDQKNFEAFNEAHTDNKETLGGRGVGRFGYLYFFDHVDVDSVYSSVGELRRRTFRFDASGDGVHLSTDGPANGVNLVTSVSLIQPHRNFESVYTRLDPSVVARKLVEHFLYYFVSDPRPHEIYVSEANGPSTSVTSLFRDEYSSNTSKFSVGTRKFSLFHLRSNSARSQVHKLLFCSNGRVAVEHELRDHDMAFSSDLIAEDLAKFNYTGLVSSDYLDMLSIDSRKGLDWPADGDMQHPSLPTSKQVIDAALLAIRKDLKSIYTKAAEAAERKLKSTVAEKAPTFARQVERSQEFRNALRDVPATAGLSVEERCTIASSRAARAIAQSAETITERRNDESVAEIRDRVAKAIEEIGESNRTALCEYIVRRHLVLEMVEAARRADPTGTFPPEEAIHRLIAPMKRTSTGVSDRDDYNLWILDDRLVFHELLTSDDTFVEDSRKEPDIVAFQKPFSTSECSDAERIDTVCVYEFKRAGRGGYRVPHDPLTQIIEYVNLLKEGKIKRIDRTILRLKEGTCFFGFAVCDDVESIRKIARTHYGMRDVPGSKRMRGQIPTTSLTIELVPIDSLVSDARLRNKIFFKKLGLQVPGTEW